MDGSTTSPVAEEPTSDSLDVLQTQDPSLLGLLKVMLSAKTLPHVVLLGGVTVLLFALARNDVAALSALGFLAMAGGYGVTALLSRFERVRTWTELGSANAGSTKLIWRLIAPFRICLFPFLMALLVGFAINALFGEGGVIGLGLESLPLVLGTGFVLWAVVQGRSIGAWLAAVAARRLPEPETRPQGSTATSSALIFVVLGVTSTVLLFSFAFFLGDAESFVDINTKVAVFWVAFGVVFALAWKRSATARAQAAQMTQLHRFAGRWMFLSQALIVWHMLTVWRHVSFENSAALFLEEVVLMVFTVVMAIWSLTSRTFKSSFQLIDDANALPFGLAFGYAYAGSVSMVTVQLETDVQGVMIVGHAVVILTLLWLQPRTLNRVVVQHASLAALQSTLAALPAAGEETRPPLQPAQPSPTENDVSERASVGEGLEAAVDWQAPDVLADGVSWDDDEVELVG